MLDTTIHILRILIAHCLVFFYCNFFSLFLCKINVYKKGREQCIKSLSYIFADLKSGPSPVIIEHPMNITVPEDEPVTLNCKASLVSSTSKLYNHYGGSSSFTTTNNIVIEWFKEGQLVTTSSQGDPHAHRILLPDGSLFFLGAVKGRDDGVYWCVATNNHGFVRSRNATIRVACKS